MKTLLSFYHTHKKSCYFAAGLILACLFMVPFLLLGTGSIITYHDQLDGELLNYILASKYLFTDIRVYPELMNGLPAAGAVPPAPLFVLLYVIFRPFTAFMVSQWILYLIAFSGMYLLLSKLTGKEFISFGISVIFMLLPFYPVYGLCIPGQPLLLYAVLSLHEISRKEGTNPSLPGTGHSFRKYHALFYYLLIVLYGAASSPVLVGFACLLVLGLWAVFESVAALRRGKAIPLSLWSCLAVLLITYVVFNFGLIRQVLFPQSTYVSHKTELVLSAQEPVSYFKEIFGTGISYAQSYPAVLLLLAALCLLLFLLRLAAGQRTAHFSGSPSSVQSNRQHAPKSAFSRREGAAFDPKNLFFKAALTLLFIIIICLFAVFYHGSFMTGLRNSSGGVLKTFNLDRVCWLLPTAWCILAAYLLAFVADFFESRPDPVLPRNAEITASSHSRFRIPLLNAVLRQGIVFATLGLWGITVLFHSAAYPNLSKLIKGGNYYALDWKSFFAEDIFIQIDDAIGKPKESYRVVSIGIYPAAASYNGFFCLDGYSNNYPLSYKHTFRQIIEGELEKSDYVRALFDNWGNRCYITTAEQADYYTFEKKWNSVIYDLDLNADVLRELNCQYVFSAAYLMNAEESGLSLLRETPFEAEGSWYHIYVYKVEG